MTAPSSPKPELDDAALAFAEQVFDSTRKGDAARLADLLRRGLPANIRNHNGDSLLMLASYHGHLDASRVLLENGADPQLCNDKGQSPLAGAAFKGNLAMTRLLLDHGADVESASPDGKTALMMAAMFDRSDIVDRFWSEEVARWYPEGQSDSNLALLRFDAERAQIWIPGNGPEASELRFSGSKQSQDIRATATIPNAPQ